MWGQSVRELTRQIYALTKQGSFAKDFGLRDQVCRAAVSIMSNIAEGYESQTEGLFIRHLGVAKGSAGELRSRLCVPLDQRCITQAEFDALSELSRKVARQLARFIQYLGRCRSRPPTAPNL